MDLAYDMMCIIPQIKCTMCSVTYVNEVHDTACSKQHLLPYDALFEQPKQTKNSCCSPAMPASASPAISRQNINEWLEPVLPV